jgi:ElaB/YqjD/DUF883 family membrane-anchored ribosome-binding protein
MTGPDRSPPEPGPDAGIEDIQADVEQTREEIGETVGALSAKLDVKTRAKQRVSETRERLAAKSRETKDLLVDKTQKARSTAVHAATDEHHSMKPAVPVTGIAVLAAITTGVVVWRRRR